MERRFVCLDPRGVTMGGKRGQEEEENSTCGQFSSVERNLKMTHGNKWRFWGTNGHDRFEQNRPLLYENVFATTSTFSFSP